MIWFMAPHLPSMSGGLRVIDNYVNILNQSGLPARVWLGRPSPHSDASAASVVATTMQLSPGDVLVMPEVGGQKWQFLTGDHPVVMLCQGTDFVYANTDFTAGLPGPYPGWPNAKAVVGVSDTIIDFLRAACDPSLPIYQVPVQIDTDRFRPRPKERWLALMPRRRREDLLAVVQLIRASGELPDWQFRLIDGMTADQVGENLGRSAIFLYGAEREGVGLPGAEALASEAFVVGFTGHGAKEYLHPEFSTVIPESDVVLMAREAIAAARQFESDPIAFGRRTAAGRQYILDHYSLDAVRAALVSTFSELTRAGSPAVLTASASIDHYERYGPKPGLPWAAYRGARRWARRAVDAGRRLSPLRRGGAG